MAVASIPAAFWMRRPERGWTPEAGAMRAAVGIKHWVRGEHRSGIRWVVVVALTVLALFAFVGWLFSADSARPWWMTGFAVIVWGAFSYVAHKCCPVHSARRKLFAAASSFLVGVQGNYVASLTLGSGSDAMAIQERLAPLTLKLDEVASALGRVERKVDIVIGLSQETQTKIDNVVDRLLKLVQQRDLKIEMLEEQVRAAVERAVLAEMADGKGELEAIAEIDSSDPGKIVDSLDTAIAKFQPELVRMHRERAAICSVVGDTKRAESSLRIVLAADTNDVDALIQLGHVLLSSDRLDEAEQAYLKASSLSVDQARRANLYGNLGNVVYRKGLPTKAIEYYGRALAIFEDLKNNAQIAHACANLGQAYSEAGRLDAAEGLFQRSRRIGLDLGDFMISARAAGMLGQLEMKRGHWDLAEPLIREALDANEKAGRREGMAIQYAFLGDIAWARRDANEAKRWWILSRDMFETLGAKARAAVVQNRIDALPRH